MVRIMPRILLPGLLGLLAIATPVLAQGRSDYVNDEAGLFSKEAKARANGDIARLYARIKHELVVDTVVTVKRPADIDAKDKAAVNRFFNEWAEKRFAQEKIKGVYIVIVMNPPKLRVRMGDEAKKMGIFRAEDIKELDNLLLPDLKAAYDDAMKNQEKNDKVLSDAVAFVQERMARHASQGQAAVHNNHNQAQVGNQRQAGETPWLTYVLIGLGVLLVIWLISGIARGLSGGTRPGMGGMGGGGGGGGFFSSMLGGLFGAAAGMWLYNSFFGGQSSSWGAGGGSGGGGNDADTGSTGDGGDYGSSGEQGGDTGGGGDWGDGGGGGDWGGGGGGDFGGGGGDFGGGGGGGDW